MKLPRRRAYTGKNRCRKPWDIAAFRGWEKRQIQQRRPTRTEKPGRMRESRSLRDKTRLA